MRIAETLHFLVGFEVLTAVSMKIAVFWVVTPCSLVEVYQRFRGPCNLHFISFYCTEIDSILVRWYSYANTL
jgi:hypothetical protein